MNNNLKHIIYELDNSHLSSLPDESVQFIVTSPPYVTTEFKKGQTFDYEGFLLHFENVCKELLRVLVAGGRFALNIADVLTKYRYKDEDTISRASLALDAYQVAQNVGFRMLDRYIWDKGYTRTLGGPILGSYPYPLTLFNNNYFEYIFILRKPGKRKVSQQLRKNSQVTLEEWRKWSQQWWRVESISEKFNYHRAIFPVEIPYRLVRMYSYLGDTVLDPYAGTGATMIAANRSGRNSIGFEIEPCKEMIQRRIEFEADLLNNDNEIQYSIKRKI